MSNELITILLFISLVSNFIIIVKFKKIKQNYVNLDQDYLQISNERTFLENELDKTLARHKQEIAEARQDTLVRSKAINEGQAVENVAVLHKDFDFNPKDCRQLGQPIDYIVFKGLSKNNLEEIVFVEIKTGKSKMNKREMSIRDIIKEGRVSHKVINLKKSELS